MDKRQDRIVEIRTGAEDLRRLGLVDRAELQDRLADELQRRLDQPAVRPTEPEGWTMTESQRRQIAEELAILRQLEDAARLTPHGVLEELAVLDDESASPVAVPASVPQRGSERRRVELLFLVYRDAWGDGSYPVSLGGICHAGGWWRTAAEDLAYRGLVTMRSSDLRYDDVVFITPAGRAQAEEWASQYALEQRLVADELAEEAREEAAAAVQAVLGDGWEPVARPCRRVDWTLDVEGGLQEVAQASFDNGEQAGPSGTAPLSPEEDEDVRLARIAHEYGARGAGGVKPKTITLWEKIVILKKIPLDHQTIADRLGISLDKFNYHKKKMKETGYWEDNGLEQQN